VTSGDAELCFESCVQSVFIHKHVFREWLSTLLRGLNRDAFLPCL